MGQERHDDAHQVVTAQRPSIGSSGLRPGDWWRHSDVHILMVAAGWILGSSALLNRTVAWPFLLLASVGAFLVYRVDRLLVVSREDAINAQERVDFTRKYRVVLLGIAVIMTGAAAWAAFHLELAWMEVSLAVGMLGLVYPLRILPGGRRPKDIPGLKTLLIAGCWVGGGVVLPAVMPNQGPWVRFEVLLTLVVYRTLNIMPNLLIADWVDRAGDPVTGWGGKVSAAVLQRLIVATILLQGVLVGIMIAQGFLKALLIVDALIFICMACNGLLMIKRGQGNVLQLDLWISLTAVTWILWYSVRFA